MNCQQLVYNVRIYPDRLQNSLMRATAHGLAYGGRTRKYLNQKQAVGKLFIIARDTVKKAGYRDLTGRVLLFMDPVADPEKPSQCLSGYALSAKEHPMVSYDGTAPNSSPVELHSRACLEMNHRSYQRRRYDYTCHIPERRRIPDRRIMNTPKYTKPYGWRPHLESPGG